VAGGALRCSCGRGGDCPHRAIWQAMGLPEPEADRVAG